MPKTWSKFPKCNPKKVPAKSGTKETLFLLKFLENDLIKAKKDSFENRVFNKNYNYTFKKQAQFTSRYDDSIYQIFTNDLGFRDDSTQPLDRDKEYSILIGDSFIEGVGLDYKDTIVGILNENLENNKLIASNK